MKKLFMLFAVVLSTLFASCDDEEVIDCSASYPFDVARFYSTENADMITFNAERSVFNYIQGLTAYTNIEYVYKMPYFIFDENNDFVKKCKLKSIQVADTLALNVTYMDGSVVRFQANEGDDWKPY